jgi:hypothetical protein
MKGLLLHVYRHGDPGWPDTTAGGVSATHDKLVLVGTQRYGEDWKPLSASLMAPEANDKHPKVVLVQAHVPNAPPHLVPLEYVEKGRNTKEYAGPMFGGNYATGDSRFSDLGPKVFEGQRLGAVAIHDRVESWATYYALSSD